MTEDIHIRTPPAFRRHLEALAEARGSTISQAVRWAVMEAALPEGGVPDGQEVLELLGQAARCGSVSAMKELLAYHREREAESDEFAEFAEFDELARRRSRGG